MMPAIDGQAYETITEERVERALQLEAMAYGKGVYRVTGGGGPHWVNLYDPSMPRCDCYDHTGREVVCKHICRVLIDIGDRRLLAHIKLLLRRPQHAE